MAWKLKLTTICRVPFHLGRLSSQKLTVSSGGGLGKAQGRVADYFQLALAGSLSVVLENDWTFLWEFWRKTSKIR